MPLVRIDVPMNTSEDKRRQIGDVVYNALKDVMHVPENDRFQIISSHFWSDLIIDKTYMGIARSSDAIIIQITLTGGRSVDQKKALYKAIAEGPHTATGMRIEDVFIGLVEVVKENWSYGNGIGQLIRDTPPAP